MSEQEVWVRAYCAALPEMMHVPMVGTAEEALHKITTGAVEVADTALLAFRRRFPGSSLEKML